MGAIYQPKGKAAEYSKYAANFYNYCSGGCTYCYLNEKPLCLVRTKEKSLKGCFTNKDHAYEIFKKEADKNKYELQKHGLFFNFNSDPFLKDTIALNLMCMSNALRLNIQVKILTKQTWWASKDSIYNQLFFNTDAIRENFKIGFTLTGHDELETGCATNAERIEAMKVLKERGFKTWASIEPVIDIENSLRMIKESYQYCDHYKIGLLSGSKIHRWTLRAFISTINIMLLEKNDKITIYWKDDLLKKASMTREDLPGNCVGRDYL
jgi:DNA repair photolyase